MARGIRSILAAVVVFVTVAAGVPGGVEPAAADGDGVHPPGYTSYWTGTIRHQFSSTAGEYWASTGREDVTLVFSEAGAGDPPTLVGGQFWQWQATPSVILVEGSHDYRGTDEICGYMGELQEYVEVLDDGDATVWVNPHLRTFAFSAYADMLMQRTTRACVGDWEVSQEQITWSTAMDASAGAAIPADEPLGRLQGSYDFPGYYPPGGSALLTWDLTLVCEHEATGQTVDCDEVLGTGEIELELLTDPWGEPTPFEVTGALDGTLTDGGTLESWVPAGRHQATVDLPEGWTVTSVWCDDGDSLGHSSGRVVFEVDAGERVRCSVTVADIPRRYAPLVHLHPSEDHRPMSARDFIASSELKWAKYRCPDADDFAHDDPEPALLGSGGYVFDPGEQVCAYPGKSPTRPFGSNEYTRPGDPLCGEVPAGKRCKSDDIGHSGEGFFLDLDDDARPGASVGEIAGGEVPVYYEFVPGDYVVFWLFYGYSTPVRGWLDGPGELGISHEGDWERVIVHLDSFDQPTSVEYFFHHWSADIPWGDVDKTDGTHPHVYAALEGHGSYWDVDNCDFQVEWSLTPWVLAKNRTYDDCSDEGVKWETWDNVEDVERESWYGFGGAWGESGWMADTTGPPAPHPSVDSTSRGNPDMRFVEEPNPLEVAAGDLLEVLWNGPQRFRPGSPVSLTLFSDPQPLGTVTSKGDGSVAATVGIPSGTPAGDHELTLTGAGEDGRLLEVTFLLEVDGSSGPGTDPKPLPADGLVRLSGASRFATAAAISAATFAPGVEVVFVATGGNYPDALAGGAAAAAEGGPVLLVNASSVPAETEAELKRLKPGRIVLLGGPKAVDAGVRERLAAFAPVQRLSGASRFATAAAISAATFPSADTVFVATGENYPDALAGSAAAAVAGAPVLLVGRDSLPPGVPEELARLGPDRIVILGGTGAVAESLEPGLRAFLP